MTTDTRYNGWTNYETWNVKLWLDNEEGDYRYWKDAAETAYREALDDEAEDSETPTAEETQDAIDEAVGNLADQLKTELDQEMEERGVPALSGFYADLLNAALSEVDWHEIAASMIEDVDK